jgi:hypothetical protein
VDSTSEVKAFENSTATPEDVAKAYMQLLSVYYTGKNNYVI